MAFTPYLTYTEADTLLANILDTDAWDDASNADKTKALFMASQAIDRLDYMYSKTSDTQDNEFPRNGDTAIPEDIQWATAYEAMMLLEGKDPEFEREELTTSRDRYAAVSTQYIEAPEDHINNGIMSIKAWNFLLPHLNDLRSLKMERLN